MEKDHLTLSLIWGHARRSSLSLKRRLPTFTWHPTIVSSRWDIGRALDQPYPSSNLTTERILPWLLLHILTTLITASYPIRTGPRSPEVSSLPVCLHTAYVLGQKIYRHWLIKLWHLFTKLELKDKWTTWKETLTQTLQIQRWAILFYVDHASKT